MGSRDPEHSGSGAQRSYDGNGFHPDVSTKTQKSSEEGKVKG